MESGSGVVVVEVMVDEGGTSERPGGMSESSEGGGGAWEVLWWRVKSLCWWISVSTMESVWTFIVYLRPSDFTRRARKEYGSMSQDNFPKAHSPRSLLRKAA